MTTAQARREKTFAHPEFPVRVEALVERLTTAASMRRWSLGLEQPLFLGAIPERALRGADAAMHLQMVAQDNATFGHGDGRRAACPVNSICCAAGLTWATLLRYRPSQSRVQDLSLPLIVGVGVGVGEFSPLWARLATMRGARGPGLQTKPARASRALFPRGQSIK